MKTFTIGLALVLVTGTVFAGRVPGQPMSMYDIVDARDSRYHIIAFNKDELASVLVDGDGSSDLDCFVYDDRKNIVATDIDNTDVCLLLWVPDRTSRFIIEIRNLGDVNNEFLIKAN